MTINDIKGLCTAKVLAGDDRLSREVTCGYTCDLLSWVMARGAADMAWVTVQTHMNVVAVASLLDMAVIILPDDLSMEEPVLEKAREEGICVLSSPHSAYAICGILTAANIPAAVK